MLCNFVTQMDAHRPTRLVWYTFKEEIDLKFAAGRDTNKEEKDYNKRKFR